MQLLLSTSTTSEPKVIDSQWHIVDAATEILDFYGWDTAKMKAVN